jgi:hypothetical protein
MASGIQRFKAQTALCATGFGGPCLLMVFFQQPWVANQTGGPESTFEKLASLTRTSWSVLLVAKLYSGGVLLRREHTL